MNKNSIEYLVFRFNRLYASVQASIMFGFGTSMYTRSANTWILILKKVFGCEKRKWN